MSVKKVWAKALAQSAQEFPPTHLPILSGHKLDGFPIVHDFVLAGPYLIFFVPPVRAEPFSVLFGLSSYSDALQCLAFMALGTPTVKTVRDRDSRFNVSIVEPTH